MLSYCCLIRSDFLRIFEAFRVVKNRSRKRGDFFASAISNFRCVSNYSSTTAI